MSSATHATLRFMKHVSDEEIGAVLAENLKRARERAGLAQREVASHLETHEMQISRWETGKTSPHAVTLARLAALYHVPIDILYVKDHPMLPPRRDVPEKPTGPPKPAPPKSRTTPHRPAGS